MKYLLIFYLFITCFTSNIYSQHAHKKGDVLTKAEIQYIYNRLLDEVLQHDYLVFIEYFEYFEYYKKNNIIIEINTKTSNKIFEFYKSTKLIDSFKIIPMTSNVKDIPFLTLFPNVKYSYENDKEYFNKGIIHIDFTDIIYAATGTFYLGVEKILLIPGGSSKEINSPYDFVLEGKVCPSGQIILKTIWMQGGAGVELSSTTCHE